MGPELVGLHSRLSGGSLVGDNAMAASGFEGCTELVRFLDGSEGPDHRAIEHSFTPQIGPSDDWTSTGEFIGEFCLQAAERGSRFSLGPL